MRLNIVKSKNAEQLYIIKSVRVNGKSTSRIIKKLGTMASLLPKFNNDRESVISWAKNEAEIMTQKENEGRTCIEVTFSEDKFLEHGKSSQFNIGYLFVKNIFHKLCLDQISFDICNTSKVSYKLKDILLMLIATRLIAPSSKLSSYDYAFNFIEKPSYDLHHVYRSLNLLANNLDKIQADIYENSKNLVNRNKEILFYDCTNYFFEIENERGFAKYGKSKEHRPNPIVQMGLFLDGDGFPLCFSMFDGNKNEQPSLKPLEKKILADFNLSEFIVCTDAGLASYDNRKFNSINGRGFIVTQPLKKLKDFLIEWSLDSDGWTLYGTKEKYNINKIDENLHENDIFYKERWIKENEIEQRLIVSYSVKQKNYQRYIRQRQIDRAKKIVDKGFKAETKNLNSPKRFVSKTSLTNDGKIADKTILSLDSEKIDNESKYDGFYAVYTNLEKDINEIISINKMRWQVEKAFRTMKTEFNARPVYLRRDDRINAHFLTCFLSLLVLKVIENKLDKKYTQEKILHTLRNMNVHKLRDLGYLSSYERTEVTDDLHERFGFRTDYEYISEKTMKKILKFIKTQ